MVKVIAQLILRNYLIKSTKPKQSIINFLYKLIYEDISLLRKIKLIILSIIQGVYYSKLARQFGRYALGITLLYTLGVLTMSFEIESNNYKINELNNKVLYYSSIIIDLNSKLESGTSYTKSKKYVVDKYRAISGVPIPNDIDSIHLVTMINTAKFFSIPERIYFRWLYKESGFDSLALSPKRASGYTQMLKSTFDLYRLDKMYNFEKPTDNIKAGGYILASLYNKYKNWSLALSAYNAGEGSIVNNKRPNYIETLNYVDYILK